MSVDGELERWRQQWQNRSDSAVDAVAVERLRRQVLRETRWSKLALIVPMLVTVGGGGAVVWRALRTGQTLDLLLAVESWLFIIAVWVVSLWIARGTWRPLADTTAAFIDVSMRRRQANIRGCALGASFYVFQWLFMVAVIAAVSPGGIVGVLTSNVVIVSGWIGMPTILAGLYWFSRRQRADLERLRELKRQLQGD